MKGHLSPQARGKMLFHYRPFAIAALGLGCGIALGRIWIGPWGWGVAAIFVLLGIVAWLFSFKTLFLLLFALGVGVARIQLAYPNLPQPAESCLLSGRIAQLPQSVSKGYLLTLDQATKDGNRLDGKVSLTVSERLLPQPPEYGDWVAARASLSLPVGARNDGGFDQRVYGWSQGIICNGAALEAVKLVPGKTDCYGVLLGVRTWVTNALYSLYGEETGALAAGMLLGEKGGISQEMIEDFRGAGLSHLLAVSGLHVSLLAAGVLWLLRNRSAKLRLGCTAGFLLCYCALCAFAPSTVRASIMTLCLLAGQALGRRNDSLSALAFAWLLLLLYHPFLLFTAGFLLSFCAVLGILLLNDPLRACLQRLGALGDGLALTLSAQAGTLGVTAAFFQRVPLFGLLANLLVVPLTGLALLPTLAAVLCYGIFEPLGRLVGMLGRTILALTQAVAAFASQTTALTLPAPTIWACLLLFGGYTWLSRYCMAKREVRLKLGGIFLIAGLLCWMLPRWTLPQNMVTVLAVPQGYVAHIHTANSDYFVGSAQGLENAAVQGYRLYHGLEHAPQTECGAQGVQIQLGEYLLGLRQGALWQDNWQYPLERTGQLRLWLKNGQLQIQPYGRDNHYDILMKDG